MTDHDGAFRHADPGLFDEGLLELGKHRIHYERSGNPEGIAVINLHGGPGAGLYPEERRIIDPRRYHLIQFDQRGCGKSRPLACLEENTIDDLVEDIERLRAHFGIDRWVVAGHSFGTALALVYAEKYPERVMALVLRGLCLLTEEESRWHSIGWGHVWPEAWARFNAHSGGSDSWIAAADALFDPDPEKARKAAVEMCRYELACCFFEPSDEQIEAYLDPELCVATARIGHHYAEHGWFLEDGQIERDIEKLAGIRCIVLQGRHDAVTPPGFAFRFKQARPETELHIVPFAAHMPGEPAMIAAATDLFDRLADELAPR